MTNTLLFILWGAGFVLCAGLGFIPEPQGFAGVALTALSLFFFVPPGLLVCRSHKAGDGATLRLVRNLSIASLGLTLGLLVANFLSVLWPESMGDLVHTILIIVSSPMVCSGYWALSLFLWACLLFWSVSCLRKKAS